jgi:hypothetical protein
VVFRSSVRYPAKARSTFGTRPLRLDASNPLLTRLLERCARFVPPGSSFIAGLAKFFSQVLVVVEAEKALALPDEEFVNWLRIMANIGWLLFESSPTPEALQNVMTQIWKLPDLGFHMASFRSLLLSLGVERLPVEPSRRAEIRDRLLGRFAGTEAGYRATFTMALAAQLWWQDRTEEGKALLAADSELNITDFNNRVTLKRRLDERLAGLDPNLAASYVFSIARTWAELEGDAQGLEVIEAYLEISCADYTPERLASLIRDWDAHLAADARGNLFNSLMIGLQSCGRYVEARLLFEVYFKVTAEDYQSPPALARRILRRINALRMRGNKSIAWTGSIQLLERIAPPAFVLDTAALLSKTRPQDWNDVDRLIADLLRTVATPWSPELSHAFVFSIVAVLGRVGRPRDGLRLVAAYCLREPGLENNTEAFLDRLIEWLPGRHPTMRATTLRWVADLHMQVGQPQVVAVLVGTALGFRMKHCGDRPALVDALRTLRLVSLEGEHLVLANQFAEVLKARLIPGVSAGFFIDAILWDVLDLERMPSLVESGALAVCGLLTDWFEIYEADPDMPGLERCRQTVRYLRSVLDKQGLRYNDRKAFHERVAQLRGYVARCGLFHTLRAPVQQFRN